MRLYNREPSNHLVRVLDLTKVKEEAIEFLKKMGKWESNNVLETCDSYGTVEKNGKHYLVSSEGVGSIDSLEDVRCEIDWYKSSIQDDVKSIGVYPEITTEMFYDELMRLAEIVAVTPLDKFIRTFGRRLQENYEDWEDFLNDSPSRIKIRIDESELNQN